MTLKRLSIITLKLASIISSDLRFGYSFSKALKLIHSSNLVNAYTFLLRKFRIKIQKALDISSF